MEIEKEINEVEKNVDATQITIERWIGQLRNKGKIEFRGVPKTGGYFVKEK